MLTLVEPPEGFCVGFSVSVAFSLSVGFSVSSSFTVDFSVSFGSGISLSLERFAITAQTVIIISARHIATAVSI